jgi:hypothetical protein
MSQIWANSPLGLFQARAFQTAAVAGLACAFLLGAVPVMMDTFSTVLHRYARRRLGRHSRPSNR